MKTTKPGVLRVDAERLCADFEALAQFGATPEGGVNRPTFSPAHLAAREWFREQIGKSGLAFRQDSAGNHSAHLACGPADAPALLLGSHLDSVPQGGRFDGALGVVAALEVLRVVHEAGLALPVNLEAIDFTDEEGTLVGLLGSRALAGSLTLAELEQPRGGRETLEGGLERAGLSMVGLLNARREPASLAGYLELHIEQGPRLAKAGMQIGVVTGIVGIASYRLAFIGQADHAGTAPMEDRLDASLGASAFTLAARRLVLDDFPACVVNVGAMQLYPGAFNIIPGRAELALEFRSADKAQFRRLELALLALAGQEARRFGLELDVHALGMHPPAPMNQQAQAAIARAADRLGLSHMRLASGAGHDAQSLATLCPVGMIFIPSVGGISHSPREFSHWQDCVNGANLLMHAALSSYAL